MNIEIPNFLIEMSEQLNTQDNRITADPIWMICYDKPYITEEGHHSYTEYATTHDDYNLIYSDEKGSLADNEHAIQHLIEYYPSFCDQWEEDNALPIDDFCIETHSDYLPDDIQIFHMNKTMHIVKACLTEADANFFIKRKQHDYPKLYTYVYSMVYCPQMIELRKWIMSLTK